MLVYSLHMPKAAPSVSMKFAPTKNWASFYATGYATSVRKLIYSPVTSWLQNWCHCVLSAAKDMARRRRNRIPDQMIETLRQSFLLIFLLHDLMPLEWSLETRPTSQVTEYFLAAVLETGFASHLHPAHSGIFDANLFFNFVINKYTNLFSYVFKWFCFWVTKFSGKM